MAAAPALTAAPETADGIEPERDVQVLGAWSGEHLCTLQMPPSSTMLDIKRSIWSECGNSVPGQRLLVEAAVQLTSTDDNDVISSYLEGDTAMPLRVRLIQIGCTDTDNDVASRRLLDAARTGQHDAMEQLLKVPTYPNYTDSCGRSALHLASEGGYHDIVQLLCEAGAEVNCASDDGTTPLMIACTNGHFEVVIRLCKAKADLNLLDEEGNSALMMAAEQGSLDIVRMLCKAGADRKLVQKDGNSALEIAAQNGHIEVEQLLRREDHATSGLPPRAASWPLRRRWTVC